TENDVILADGCTCAGTPIPTGCNPAYTLSPGAITVTGLNGPHNSINLFDTDNGWMGVFSCFDDCDNPTIIDNLPAGNYYIHIKILDEFYQIDCQIAEPLVISEGCDEGAACNDGDICTENDVFDVDCNCIGTPVADEDGDGICAVEDCDDTDASIPAAPGTSCDDGNPDTVNDVILADGCTCEGIDASDPCALNGGDEDGDGICAVDDCDDTDASIPTTPGTACDDGYANTENDEIQADGCTCAGTPIQSVCNPSYEIAPGSVTVSGLTGAHNSINLFDTSNGFVGVFSCFDDCGNPAIIDNLPGGNYYIHIKIFNEFFQIDCEITEDIVVPEGNCAEGSPCDDGDVCTENDVYDVDCNCAGTPLEDGDGDGYCVNEDCDDTDASIIPLAPGTACDDGDADTVGDVILADGCTCAGTTPQQGCTASFTAVEDSIVVSGLTSANLAVTVFDQVWGTVFHCFGDCSTPTQSIAVSPGTYFVKVQLWDESFSPICVVEDFLTVGGISPLIAAQNDLLFFTANKAERSVLLNWTINTEFKTQYFEIERSEDGQNFVAIADRNAYGTMTSQPVNYQQLDQNPILGTNHYRIKQVFNDGTFRYTAVQQVEFGIDLNAFVLYPNPT
ncbi:MAG: hypothetical protein AAGD05_15890, partial [Bacteroidota bacterium]